jgi:hypothetical protein
VQSAIVIVGPECREDDSNRSSLATAAAQEGTALVCVELLGVSVMARFLEELRRGGIEMISVFGNAATATARTDSANEIEFCSTDDPWLNATEHLSARRDRTNDLILIMRMGAYVDLDLKEFFQFHREQKQAVTRAFDKDGALDLWIVDPAGIPEGANLASVLRVAEPAQYVVRGYVNRLQHPRDLRRLAVDSLTNRCRLRPLGTETRSGVWIEEGAQVHRDARIVAPVFIGRGTRIGEQCLITRASNVESNCQIDYGTVVEDSSILSNSYVGIGLDLSHSIVDGSALMNLERGVTLEIADPCVVRPNRVLRQDKNLRSPVAVGLGSVQLPQAEESSRQM